ncbi:Maf family protein [Candidatus Methylacidithermus pantelleriae]|uniref:dTTP/UTP pyrophosphatase n=1 Tax=Candidatus Methylacidithermus pantelleriae TaxID=2744239 RepID=A0A8J2FT81_9BACT|nr:nucleoside triphosphate pyrophosphatase [Candidatus Methylacidithermus pantelleriae]CAF0703333.1 dTTP/UTP pyrophosphatase [Candidatus Methylacidithermus pantelleriae]
MKSPLCLASSSPRRQQLLRQLGVPFYSKPPTFSELSPEQVTCLSPRELALRNAMGKAFSVWNPGSDPWVLAADTLVVLGAVCLGKPKDLTEARTMLELLSGKTHHVLTALVLVTPSRQIRSLICATEVEFRRLTPPLIESYLQEVPVLDKAGAYAAQEKAEWLIKEVRGSYTNVLGFPIEEVACLLAKGNP